LRKIEIEPVKQGVVAGICGWLLAEGDRRGYDVTALLAECNPMYPDARAAAIATEALSDLVDIDIPLDELLVDARRIEDNVRQMFEMSKNLLPPPDADFEVDEGDPMIG
jgi:predicted ATP-grasp superfamily ATP-dependent carboligase